MNSLGTRLLAAATVVLLSFVLLTGWALTQADRDRAQQALQDRLQGLIYGILGAAEPDSSGRLVIDDTQLPDPRLRQINSGLHAVLSSAKGKVLWHSPSVLSPPTPSLPPDVGGVRWRSHASGGALEFAFEWETRKGTRTYLLTVEETGGTDLHQGLRFERRLWSVLALAAVLLLVTLLIVLRWGLHPVRHMTGEVHQLREGACERLSTDLPAELRPLASAVNELLDNERLRLQQQRHALDNLAHSLKTPLAVLRVQGAIGEPVERMQQLIDYHLQRASSGVGASFAPPLALAPIAEQIAAALRKLHAAKKLNLRIEIEPDLQLRIERGECMELLGNLMDNAAKWARHRVDVRAQINPDHVILIIDDDGPGFPADAERLLARGARADERPGQGIGLAAVTDIVRAHGGTLHLGHSTTGGGRVRIELPRRQPHS